MSTRRALSGWVLLAAVALPLTGCFSAPPQITSLEPNRGSTDVAADAPVRVVFDRAVDHGSVAGRFTASPADFGCDFSTVFTASSTAPCSIHWLDNQPGFELLHPGAVFRPSTHYDFTLAGGFTDLQGDRNSLDHHWDINTGPAPRLAAASPGDGAGDVPVDTPVALSFSAPMDDAATAAAITLQPAVAGTRVVRNVLDHNRFAIVPGELLDPGIDYTVTVGAAARGEDGQAIAAPAAIHFTTGVRVALAHAAVLAGPPGGAATEVLLPALAPGAAGEPVATPLLLQAPRCLVATGCGPVSLEGPLFTFREATIAADGRHLAVVIDDPVAASSRLEVLDVVHDAVVADIPDGAGPSWSPDGSQLALTAGSEVEVLDARSGAVTALTAGAGLTALPLWAGESTVVLSIAGASGAAAGIELVNRPTAARYGLPGAPPASMAVAVSAAGSRLAVTTTNGLWVIPAGGGSGAPQRLPDQLVALGFSGEGTLVALDTASEPAQLVRVSLAGGDSTPIGLGGAAIDPLTVRVAPDGRRLVFLATDAAGTAQVLVANADGSGGLALTAFVDGAGLEAQAVAFAD